MPYRYRDPSPVLENLLGTAAAAGGFAYFYVLGDVNTPKDTYQEYALSTPNPNPIQLDANGRFPNPVWLNGDYTYELKAANGSSIVNPTDIRPEIAPGLAIPDPLGHSGEFLTNDGTTISWSGPVWMLPDPTGSAGDMLVVNSTGDGYILQAQPSPEELNIGIDVSATSAVFTGEDGTKMKIVWGTGTTTTGVGSKNATGAVGYPSAFSATAIVGITAIGGPFAPGNGAGGYYADVSAVSPTASGFTANFNTNHGEENADGNISGPITFHFIAVGPVA